MKPESTGTTDVCAVVLCCVENLSRNLALGGLTLFSLVTLPNHARIAGWGVSALGCGLGNGLE
jgi:hypothetical protein